MELFYTGRCEEQFQSDLAAERRRADLSVDGIEMNREVRGDFVWERIKVSSKEGEKSIGRPRGNYDTLTLPAIDTMSEEEIYDGAEEVARELCRMLEQNGIFPERILVVGLGNAELTPDSVGPKAAALTEATRQIKAADPNTFYSLECSEISVLCPGVTANSGIEAGIIVRGVCDELSPDVIFAIDSLAASSPARLGRTIQISDTGIFPGSGLGLRRMPLNEDSLGSPVIAIGVPTVINSRSFFNSAKRELNAEEMFVSPREIDKITKNASKIIAMGINQAFGIMS